MNELATPSLLTTQDFLAMPEEDQVEYELIRGELRQHPMTRRNFSHGRTTTNIAAILKSWLENQPGAKGLVLTGEAGFCLRHDPDTTVGIDVAYISAELAAQTPRTARLVDGIPVLAVEILSPSDKHEDVSEKVEEYLAAGVFLVWIVDPVFATISVYRPDALPQLFNRNQEVSGEPHLPGLKIPVSKIFE